MKKTIIITVSIFIVTVSSFYGCMNTQCLTPEQQDTHGIHAIPATNILKDIGTAD